MDTAKWSQDFVVNPMNELVVTNSCLKQSNPPSALPMERKARPEKDQALNCPRCNSLNTKFCYYNNYSLTQPRYFCKDCRRYWTEGGSLRNIPVGGGVRKNKRSSSSSSSNSYSPSSFSSSKKPLYANNTNTPAPLPQLNPKISDSAKAQDLTFSQGFGNAHEAKDLNLAFSQGLGIGHYHHQSIPEFLQVLPSHMKNNSLVSTSSALELLGISNSSAPSTSCPAFMSYLNVNDSSVYAASEFGLSYPQFQEFMKPALGFGGPLHHQEEGSSGTTTTTATNNGRSLLPFESLKLPVSSSNTNSGGNVNGNGNANGNGNENENENESDHEKEEREGEQSAGYWNGMLSASASVVSSGGGSWQ